MPLVQELSNADLDQPTIYYGGAYGQDFRGSFLLTGAAESAQVMQWPRIGVVTVDAGTELCPHLPGNAAELIDYPHYEVKDVD